MLSPPSSCTVKVQFLVTLCLLREHPCYKSAIMSKTDTKLDEIIASLKCLNSEMSQLNSKFDKLESKVSVLQATTVAHEQSIVELQKEVKQLKEAGNTRDQEARANVVRIFNFPTTDDETANSNQILASKVYERIFKPVLTAAKAKGDLATLPQQQTLIEDCFRARGPSSNSGPPPPVIVKLSSHTYKVALMRNKRDNIPAPTRAEATSGARPCFLVEDLTAATHLKMKELKEDKRVAKVWSVDGLIRLTLSTAPESIVKIKSPFVDFEKILSKK